MTYMYRRIWTTSKNWTQTGQDRTGTWRLAWYLVWWAWAVAVGGAQHQTSISISGTEPRIILFWGPLCSPLSSLFGCSASSILRSPGSRPGSVFSFKQPCSLNQPKPPNPFRQKLTTVRTTKVRQTTIRRCNCHQISTRVWRNSKPPTTTALPHSPLSLKQ